MSLHLGDIAPDFQAESTLGHISFHDWIGDSWALFLAIPLILHQYVQLN